LKIGELDRIKLAKLIFSNKDAKTKIDELTVKFIVPKILEYVKEHNIEMDEIEEQQLGLIHAKLGASIAKEKYNADEEVQKAILYHTTGNIKMDRFAKIIYLADKLEENRKYEGVEEKIEIEEIVLDDIIKLTVGNQVTTDCIILEGEVEVDESFITGESNTIEKGKGEMLLSGSFIESGNVIARVEHIAENNYIAVISKEAKTHKKNHSVIMDSFEKILKAISFVIIPLGILFFYTQYQLSNNMSESIFATTAAIIGMIPEGLILLTSSVMAVSIIRLSKYKVLVQH